MTAQLFNGLVALDDSLVIQPDLAQSWDISDNGTCYTFRLRSNVWFHPHTFPDGKTFHRKLTAQDVVWSFTRICDPKTASSGLWLFKERVVGVADFQAGKTQTVSGFRAVNDTTVEIRLERPFPPFLSLLAMPYAFIVPKEVVDHYGKDFRLHPVGTGAFVFKYWTEGRQLVLHKNPDYFEKGLPRIDAIVAGFISNRLSAFMELQNGNLDFIEGIDPLLRDELLDSTGKLMPKYADKLHFFLLPQLTTEYWGINMVEGLLAQKPALRLAINHAIDRRQLTRHLLKGLALPASSGLVPRGMPSFSDSVRGYDYHPQKVKRYLAEAGFPDGKGLPELTLHTTPLHTRTAELLQHQLAKFNIRIKIETVEGATLREVVSKGKATLWRASWIADYPDAENYLSLLLTANHAPTGPNTTRFSDPEYDRLLTQALTETNDSARFRLYHRAERLMLSRAPLVPLYYYRTVRLARKGWTNLPTCAMPTVLPLKQVTYQK
jgi:peptide/nickel transport system substrate-binding protein